MMMTSGPQNQSSTVPDPVSLSDLSVTNSYPPSTSPELQYSQVIIKVDLSYYGICWLDIVENDSTHVHLSINNIRCSGSSKPMVLLPMAYQRM